MAPQLTSEDLLPGEVELRSFGASFYVVAADWGVKARTGTPFAGLFGLKGLELVGGALHLTNWRLVFATQAINRFRGSFAIALAEIAAAKDVSRGVKRAVEIRTGAASYQFNLWGISAFLSALEAQRAALDASALAAYAEASAQAPEPREPFGRR